MTTYNPNPGIMDVMARNTEAVRRHVAIEPACDGPDIVISADKSGNMFVPKISRDGGKTFYQMNVQVSDLEKAREMAKEKVLSEVRFSSNENGFLIAMLAFATILAGFVSFFLSHPVITLAIVLIGTSTVVNILRRDLENGTVKMREQISDCIRYEP